MNVLLTGAGGFVGSYFKNKYNEKYKMKIFSFLNDNFQQLDLLNTDVIVHLSALVHQMGGASVEEYEKINVTQTIDLAKKAKKSGIKHFIFMSTVKVYGEETDIPYNENSKCLPQDEYGKSKLKAENELQKLEDDNFEVSIIRTPIVYGYSVKANIKNLVSLVQKIPVLPFGNIQNRRSMVYVGNLCHLIDEIIGFRIKSGMTNNIFLASDDKPLSTSRLIQLIANELDKKVYLVKIPFFENILKFVKPNFYKRLYGSLEVDSSKTKEILKFKNLYSTEDGVKFMIRGENK
ncbi:MAG: NAD-dependent epimerase/dehydratase family protein [Sulfurimonas sp.]|nr:NAD-dependent epimerase/dehydratase family protein [Sulfurimonas sp.]